MCGPGQELLNGLSVSVVAQYRAMANNAAAAAPAVITAADAAKRIKG